MSETPGQRIGEIVERIEAKQAELAALMGRTDLLPGSRKRPCLGCRKPFWAANCYVVLCPTCRRLGQRVTWTDEGFDSRGYQRQDDFFRLRGI